MAIKKLGHVGIYAQNFEMLRDFYTNVIGLKVADQGANIVFFSADPKREHHELVMFRAKDATEKTKVQQISFSCESLEDIVGYYHRFKANNVKFRTVTSHGNAVGLYFFDPEDNVCEVYWTTPFAATQPYAVAIDLTRPIDEILRTVEADVREHAATGHLDPESFVRQKEQLARDGVRI